MSTPRQCNAARIALIILLMLVMFLIALPHLDLFFDCLMIYWLHRGVKVLAKSRETPAIPNP